MSVSAIGAFSVREDAYSEPYDPPQFCDICGILVDGYTRPEDHEPICERHPDWRVDLAELEELDAPTGPLAAPVARREVA